MKIIEEKIAVVKWRDSCLCLTQEPKNTNWQYSVITSVGYVLENNATEAVLAGDLLDEDVRRAIVIPAENIIEFNYL